MIADRCEKHLDSTLADISRQPVTLINIMSLGDNWISQTVLSKIEQSHLLMAIIEDRFAIIIGFYVFELYLGEEVIDS